MLLTGLRGLASWMMCLSQVLGMGCLQLLRNLVHLVKVSWSAALPR